MKALILHELIQMAEKADVNLSSKERIESLDTEILVKIQSQLQRYSSGQIVNDDFKRREMIDLLNQLVDPILLLNDKFPSSTELGKAYYRVSKLLLVAELLIRTSKPRASLFIAEEVIKESIANNFMSICYQAYRIQYKILHYSGELKRAERARVNFKLYLEYYQIESEMEMDYHTILAHYSSSKMNDAKVALQCEQIERKYEAYVGVIPSFYFHNHYFFIIHVKLVIQKRHEEVLANANRALKWMNIHSPKYFPGILTFRNVQITYFIQKGLYDNCKRILEHISNIVAKNTQAWFRMKENELLLYFHQGSYDLAVDLFYEEYAKKAFLSIHSLDQQRWKLYEAYIQLVMALGLGEAKVLVKRFNVQKLINDLPRFSKDKRAMNIPLLIVQLLFLITKKRYIEAIDRIDALGRYTTRYLRNDETFRSNCFIRMLLIIPKQGFNKKAVERSSLPLFNRMIQSEIQLIDQPFEIEIIPYENLWEIILSYLSTKHHNRDKRSKSENQVIN